MKKATKTASLALLALSLLSQPALAASNDPSLADQRTSALNYLHDNLQKSSYKYTVGWASVALYDAGESVTSPKWSNADGTNGVIYRESEVRRNVNLSDATTDFESTLLGLLSANQNPRAFGKKDFIQAILSSQRADGKFADTIYGEGEDLLNAHIYGIIALYSAGVSIPNADQARDYLLSKQHADGGFNWAAGDHSNPDVTAFALIAMKALGLDASNPAVQKALNFLKNVQNTSGGFSNEGTDNPDSATTVLQALVAYGIDPKSYSKSGHDLFDFLNSFRTANGGFSYTLGGDANAISTQFVLMAYSDLLNGKTVFQKLHDENVAKSSTWTQAFPDLPFTHPYYADNMKLANLGVMAGHTDGTYGTGEPVTREQFAKILVSGAHLDDEVGAPTTQFTDVDNGWANPYIAVALKHKFVYGTSNTTYNPLGEITGAEVMAILVRMLGSHYEQEAQSRPKTDWYDGYVAVAKEHHLLYPNFNVNAPATRAEVGYSFVRLYDEQLKAQ
ncbi:S-layer homology domain-containing protein [Tumebacillus sp. ITR2]|uniref:S-layer homology domain-containing protein n=1 Tax=Tumebacillus amylolyticus TaxID=2801339 RepID=A0ABS1J791_9BACL|nr:S-layer homology domain-containing protein [Tumebacillus amylolyticus]MBL0386141.1 S-layer homology domain-containing protein [Tumebacillus amylolyticus]